jgi:hypothetical protein
MWWHESLPPRRSRRMPISDWLLVLVIGVVLVLAILLVVSNV